MLLVKSGFLTIPFERVAYKAFPQRCRLFIFLSGGIVINKNTFELTHPNAAGIDIGASSHFVAVPSDRDEQPVREFPSFTEDLYALADWLTACTHRA